MDEFQTFFKRGKRSKNKHRDKWQKHRKLWFEANPASSYVCFYCGRFLYPEQTTLDHYHSRSRRPDLRYEMSNLVPCCLSCNLKKGSIDGDDYMKKIGKEPRGTKRLRNKKLYYEKSETEPMIVKPKKDPDWAVFILIGAIIGFVLATGYYRYELDMQKRAYQKHQTVNCELGF